MCGVMGRVRLHAHVHAWLHACMHARPHAGACAPHVPVPRTCTRSACMCTACLPAAECCTGSRIIHQLKLHVRAVRLLRHVPHARLGGCSACERVTQPGMRSHLLLDTNACGWMGANTGSLHPPRSLPSGSSTTLGTSTRCAARARAALQQQVLLPAIQQPAKHRSCTTTPDPTHACRPTCATSSPFLMRSRSSMREACHPRPGGG